MNKPSALLAAIAFFVALSFVASCGQPEPWEPPADREARAIDRLRYLLEPSEAHAQLFPSTLTDTLRLGKGRYRLIQVESAQNLLVEKFYLGPTSTRPNCNAARSGLFHINSSRQVSYCNATAWVPIGGVLRQATPPTCSDSQPVRLYEDSDDDGLYRCKGTTWTKIADDGDGDGFASSIDPDDADANVKLGTHNALSLTAGDLRILVRSFVFSDQFDTAGAGADSPFGIAVTATSVWVVDSINAEVYEFNHTGTLQSQFDTAGAGAATPRGVAVTATSVWVVDATDDEVYEFNHTGTLQSQFDTAGAGAGRPEGIAVTATSVWIVDSTVDEVYEFNHTGTLQSQFDTAGGGRRQARRHSRDRYEGVGGR